MVAAAGTADGSSPSSGALEDAWGSILGALPQFKYLIAGGPDPDPEESTQYFSGSLPAGWGMAFANLQALDLSGLTVDGSIPNGKDKIKPSSASQPTDILDISACTKPDIKGSIGSVLAHSPKIGHVLTSS